MSYLTIAGLAYIQFTLATSIYDGRLELDRHSLHGFAMGLVYIGIDLGRMLLGG